MTSRRVSWLTVLLLAVASLVLVQGPSAVAAQDAGSTVATLPGRGGFTPITPVRVADTRANNGTKTNFLRVDLSGVQLPEVGSPVATLTIVDPLWPGHATLTNLGGTQETSSVNYVAGQTVANTVVLTSRYDVLVRSYAPAHIVVDIIGVQRAVQRLGDPPGR